MGAGEGSGATGLAKMRVWGRFLRLNFLQKSSVNPQNRQLLKNWCLLLGMADTPCFGKYEFFFAPDDEYSDSDKAVRRVEQAKALCAQCRARLKCLALGLANKDVCGVWGGVNFDNEREK